MSFVQTLRAKNHITVKLDMEEMDVTVVKMKDMIALQRKKSDNGMDMILKKHSFTSVLVFHYYKLAYRSLLFAAGLVWYIRERSRGHVISITDFEGGSENLILVFIWVVFMIEMILRFFPSKLESHGCQKEFKRNYVPTGRDEVKIQDNNATVIVALLWVVMNAVIGALYMTVLPDQGIMLLLSLAYSVCDVICILFFCPFQSWFLKNKCCGTCRIFNWDFAMMFTPLFFTPGIYTWSLLIMSVILLARWEITVWRHPERFSENTNAYLQCQNCSSGLCVHKRKYGNS